MIVDLQGRRSMRGVKKTDSPAVCMLRVRHAFRHTVRHVNRATEVAQSGAGNVTTVRRLAPLRINSKPSLMRDSGRRWLTRLAKSSRPSR